MKTLLLLTKVYLKIIAAINPKLAGKQAFELFQRTFNAKVKPSEERFIAAYKTFKIDSSYGQITCYENGNSAHPTVLLVHGWNSNVGSMGMISSKLVEMNFHTISFDLPAHGNHKGSYTNLFECKEVMKAVLNRVWTDEPISIVSHSLGSLVTSYALSEVSKNIDQLIFLTSPDESMNIFKFFKQSISLSDAAFEHMVHLADELLGEPLIDVSASKKLLQSQFNQLTIIHDKADKVLPFQNSEVIHSHIPHSKLIAFDRIGHYRMLWNEEVINTLCKAINHSQITSKTPELSNTMF